MNYVSLDSIGIAGFSHDFGCLSGLQSDIATTLDEFGVLSSSPLDFLIALLTPIIPFLSWIPTDRKKLLDKLRLSMHNVAGGLLTRSRGEKAAGTLNVSEKSIIGQLSKCVRIFLKYFKTTASSQDGERGEGCKCHIR